MVPPSLLRDFETCIARYRVTDDKGKAYHAARFLDVIATVYAIRELLPSAARPEEIGAALATTALSVRDQYYALRTFRALHRIQDSRLDRADRRALSIRSSRPQRAPAGTPGFMGSDYFRSQWEERTARALTRLGVPWTYEAERFAYQDRSGGFHHYTPDFRIDSLRNTFVEVKGRSGADAFDDLKMRRVLKRYPRLTLMVWDGEIVEYVEDSNDPIVVVSLLRSTTLQAA